MLILHQIVNKSLTLEALKKRLTTEKILQIVKKGDTNLHVYI